MRLPRYSDAQDRTGNNIFDRFMTLFNPDRADLVLGDIVSRILLFAIILAGLYFFVRLISAGYKYLTSTGESAKVQEATKEITNSAAGLVIILLAFFLAQIFEVIFGISIL